MRLTKRYTEKMFLLQGHVASSFNVKTVKTQYERNSVYIKYLEKRYIFKSNSEYTGDYLHLSDSRRINNQHIIKASIYIYIYTFRLCDIHWSKEEKMESNMVYGGLSQTVEVFWGQKKI